MISSPPAPAPLRAGVRSKSNGGQAPTALPAPGSSASGFRSAKECFHHAREHTYTCMGCARTGLCAHIHTRMRNAHSAHVLVCAHALRICVRACTHTCACTLTHTRTRTSQDPWDEQRELWGAPPTAKPASTAGCRSGAGEERAAGRVGGPGARGHRLARRLSSVQFPAAPGAGSARPTLAST